jgi:hypothetical protein
MSDHSDDERLALEFLEAERPLKPAHERLARDALFRLLIDEKRPLPRSIRSNLACLFENDRIDGVARLDHHRPLTDIPPHRWRQFLCDCNNFLTGDENWARRAAELGWNAASLFG